MSIQSDLLARLLSLPEVERAELANQLLLSLESGEPDADRDAAWAEEVERRRLAFERGETTASHWREAIRRIENSLPRGDES